MKNGRCRFHGGKCTGAKTVNGLAKIKLTNTKHGFYSAEAMAERKYLSGLLKLSREALQ
jgi:hypothetical protein